MAGNVWEWVEDDWHDSYAGASRPDDGSAWVDGPPRASSRVFRGGSFGYDDADVLRGSTRYGYYLSAYDSILGARCCRSP